MRVEKISNMSHHPRDYPRQQYADRRIPLVFLLFKQVNGRDGSTYLTGRLLHGLGGEHLFKGHGARTKEWALIRGNTVYR